MNKYYWEQFYRKHNISFPTSFAEWCIPFMRKHLYVADLGCGSGRDSYYFAQKGHRVNGIDYAVCPDGNKDVSFARVSLKDVMAHPCGYDVVYSRFFLHSIPYTEVADLLHWARGMFLAEFRAKGDEPTLYPDHPRNFIDGNTFLNHLAYFGFDILHYEKGRGLAKYKGEDPLVIRVMAKK